MPRDFKRGIYMAIGGVMKQVNLFYPLVFIGILFAASAGYIGYLLYYNPDYTSDLIVTEIAQLVTAFKKIDNDCMILSFDAQKNPINFLNVVSFVGSEVGPMNLVHPDKWHGPYIFDHPTIQSIEYMVVRTHNGYFITPGVGVRLPNGKVIGADIALTEDADIAALTAKGGPLRHRDSIFAAPLLGPAQPAPAPRLGDLMEGVAE